MPEIPDTFFPLHLANRTRIMYSSGQSYTYVNFIAVLLDI